MSPTIHVFGASGSGTTTLAKELGSQLGVQHFDADDYFWLPSDPPFLEKTEKSERVQSLRSDLKEANGWTLSGCVAGWGDAIVNNVDLSVFVYLDEATRIKRLLQRETQEFGSRIQPGGDMHKTHLQFMQWARSYDSANPPIRSLKLHEEWMTRSPSPLLKLNSNAKLSELVSSTLSAIT